MLENPLMLRSLFKRSSRAGGAIKPATLAVAVPAELAALMASGAASRLRDALRRAADKFDLPAMSPALCQLAQASDWSERELEKLRAYVEFFSGQTAIAYQRVHAQGLAEDDYPLLMTACIHCYLYERYREAYALLTSFSLDAAKDIDTAEFLAYAGYIALSGGGNLAEALAYLDRALNAGQIGQLFAANAYAIYFEAGRLEEVRRVRQIIRERYEDDDEIRFALSFVELARGYYPEGFRLNEARYTMVDFTRAWRHSLTAYPRWQGEAIAGKCLLIHGEQGLGDTIMMARYLPQLAEIGCDVTLDCRSEALSLLEFNFPRCAFVASAGGSGIDWRYDLWLGAMSLPLLFGTTAQTVPRTGGYLRVPDEQAGYWRDRVAQTAPRGRRVGFAWSGNPAHRADARRSLRFDQLRPYLRQHRDIHFFSLQIAPPDDASTDIEAFGDELITLADTAALIAEMDLVITVDTSIVHLAGALGKKTWLLLPKRYEWRWGLEGEGNNWYESVTVLRQKTHGEWEDVLAEVFGARLPAVFCDGKGG